MSLSDQDSNVCEGVPAQDQAQSLQQMKGRAEELRAALDSAAWGLGHPDGAFQGDTLIVFQDSPHGLEYQRLTAQIRALEEQIQAPPVQEVADAPQGANAAPPPGSAVIAEDPVHRLEQVKGRLTELRGKLDADARSLGRPDGAFRGETLMALQESPEGQEYQRLAAEAQKLEEQVRAVKLAAPVSQPPEPEPPEEPYEYDHCTILVGLQLLPDDGDLAGRSVVVGVRNHRDAPILRVVRLNDLGPLPPVIGQLLDQLRADLPARFKAKEEALARQKAEEEQARIKREQSRAKARSQHKPKPEPAATPATQPPTPKAVKPASTPQPASQAGQMSLF